MAFNLPLSPAAPRAWRCRSRRGTPTTYNTASTTSRWSCAVVAVALAWAVRRSSFGLQLLAIRDDEDRARGLGVRDHAGQAGRVRALRRPVTGWSAGCAFLLPRRRSIRSSRFDPLFDLSHRADGVPRRPRHDLPARSSARSSSSRSSSTHPDVHVTDGYRQPDRSRRAVPARHPVPAAGHRPDAGRRCSADGCVTRAGPRRVPAGDPPPPAPVSPASAPERRAADERAARGRRRAKELRRRAGARRLHVRGRAGLGHRPDRPQRLRQDHDVQRHHRLRARRRGRGALRRPGDHRRCRRTGCSASGSGAPSS